MRTFLFTIVLCSVHTLWTQTLVEKTIVDSHIDFIEIDASNCFDIVLETEEGDNMQLTAKIDGEYYKNLLLSVGEQGNTLQVGAGFQPNFKKPNDKLSAHKVVSIALRIRLPQGKSVTVNGTSCNVYAKGAYMNLMVNLNDGYCVLEDISENAIVRTQSGDISITDDMAIIEAESKYGMVNENPIPKGNSKYVLETITGNIRFSKTE